MRDVDRMIGPMQAHFGTIGPGERCVIVADWRNVTMMSPETAVRASEMLTRSNPRVSRSSILTLPERSLANLQVLRLVRESSGDQRRHFTNPVEQHRWLSKVLTQSEPARLAVFLELSTAPDERALASAEARVSVRPGPQTFTSRAPRSR